MVGNREWRTFSIASLTRGESIRPLRSRFVIRDSLEEPELRHAMVRGRVCRVLGKRKREKWVRDGSVKDG